MENKASTFHIDNSSNTAETHLQKSYYDWPRTVLVINHSKQSKARCNTTELLCRECIKSFLFPYSSKIFEDSGAGSKCIRLLRVFWDMAELVYRASVYYGWVFKD